MSDNYISYHSFEKEKMLLKAFSENTTTEYDLAKVADSKNAGEIFWDIVLGRGIDPNHKVTGIEYNQLVRQIQEYFIAVNETQIKTIKEFGQVYNALEALDKDYIKDILKNVEANKCTSEGLKKAQDQIKITVDNQKRLLEELKKFKNKISGYIHLGEIDDIWAQCKNHQFQIENINKSLISVQQFTHALYQIEHISDIDEMWSSLLSVNESIDKITTHIEEIHNSVSESKRIIDALKTSIEDFNGIKHLYDIDKIWTEVESQKKHREEIDSRLKQSIDRINRLDQDNEELHNELTNYNDNVIAIKERQKLLDGLSHVEDIDSMWTDISSQSSKISDIENEYTTLNESTQKRLDEMNNSFEAKIRENKDNIDMLSKRLKQAYCIVGGTVVIAIFELIVLLVKVI